jgi:ABC-type uncharacterized transport system substrate-binding protein
MAIALLAFFPSPLFGSPDAPASKKWKILHIMSYHMPWEWTESQFNGFKTPLKDLEIEYQVFQMDTKRHNSAEWKEEAGKKARELVAAFQPDLVYVNDDDAQEYVTRYFLNQTIPFVFSAVNAAPQKYGFVGSRNITGVLEEEHFVQSARLLKGIVPTVKKIAVIIDPDPMWEPVVARMKAKLNQLPGFNFVTWKTIDTFAGYKQTMLAIQDVVDAVALIGIFGFKDEAGKNVSYREVLRWTAKHSRLPDFSFWVDRVAYGTLCAVTVSGFEQGLAAGKIAQGILVDGRRPDSYPMAASVKGEPVISLARARRLGLKINTGLLLSSQIVEHFEWDK